MKLTPESRLGPYEILAPLGAGGMGEVYRARDQRLGREVALKILPSDDTERLRRFEQEARAASALNHPNILTVYEFGSDRGVAYIATELIDGEALAACEDRGVRALLDLAVQIADGLAAAHAAGIVHRDLKPGNIMVTRDGRVKILDFGLAKTYARAAVAGDETQLLTATDPGTVLGTVAYMSPEQARGERELDFRSDQFSFGLILYELAAGRRAFLRETGPETMSAIIRDEPEPMPPSILAPLRWTIERCLAKEPGQRYSATRDLYLELRHLRDHISEAVTTSGAAPLPVAPLRRRWTWAAAPAAAIVLFASGYFARTRLEGVKEPPKFHRLTSRQGLPLGSRFTADGRSIVFNAIWEDTVQRAYQMSLDSGETRDLNLPEKSEIAGVSSKGELAILLGEESELGRVLARRPLSGGAPREVLEHVLFADWSADGESLAVIRLEGSKRRVEYPAGKVLYESPDAYPQHLRVSPDGELVAFIEIPKGEHVLRVLDRSGAVKLAAPLSDDGRLIWGPGGREVWVSTPSAGETTVRAIDLAGKQRMLARFPGVADVGDVSREGRVIVSVIQARVGILGLAPGASAERELSWLGTSMVSAISADGKLLLTTEQGSEGIKSEALYLRSTDGSPAVRLGAGQADGLSPDGKWAEAFRKTPKWHDVLLPVGPGEEKPVTVAGHGDWDTWVLGWLPDGNSYVIVSRDTGKKLLRHYVWDSAGGSLRPLTPEGSAEFALVSDDGKQMLYIGPDKKAYAVTIASGPSRPAPGIRPTDRLMRWSTDDQSVFVADTFDARLTIRRVNLATGERAVWKTLVAPAGDLRLGYPVITPDGKAYAYNHFRHTGDLFLVDGLR
jgi:Tol biopolymer transport system component